MGMCKKCISGQYKDQSLYKIGVEACKLNKITCLHMGCDSIKM